MSRSSPPRPNPPSYIPALPASHIPDFVRLDLAGAPCVGALRLHRHAAHPTCLRPLRTRQVAGERDGRSGSVRGAGAAGAAGGVRARRAGDQVRSIE